MKVIYNLNRIEIQEYVNLIKYLFRTFDLTKEFNLVDCMLSLENCKNINDLNNRLTFVNNFFIVNIKESQRKELDSYFGLT